MALENEVRQYIYIEDVIKASIESLNNKYNKQKVILIGKRIYKHI